MKEELLKIMQESQLSEEQKNEWVKMIEDMPEDVADILLKTAGEGIMDFEKMNEFYQRKKEAALVMKEDKAKGQEMLDAIYHEEAEALNKLEE